MRDNKFYSKSEKILLFVLLVVGIASLIFFFKYKSSAFPEYNIKFVINKDQAAAQSKEFLKNLTVKTDGYKQVTVFDSDNAAKIFLERQVNKEQTAKLAENSIDLWHFSTRFYKPLQQEEYIVSYLPNGRLSGYSRVVEEDKPGASLPQTKAQKIAEQFLKEKTYVKLPEWRLIDAAIERQKQRIDYTFVWEKKNFKLHDATYRMSVGIIGDQVGGYFEQLKIPQAWERQFKNERSQNDLAQSIAEFFEVFLFYIPLFLFFVIKYRANVLRLRLGLFVGGIAFIISLLESLNSLPLILYDYNTTQSWTAFLGETIVRSIIDGLIGGIEIGIIVVVGEYFYRKYFPQRIALEAIWSKGLATKEVNKTLFIGGLYGIISFASVVIFYIIGNHFGFWSPAEINYDDAFSTLIPWIYPLSIGFLAAVAEEGLFRLFGILFLIRYIKKPWIAVFITAFTWSFLHSSYPQSPWFARGIEVGIEGLLFGFLFLRFGILATIAAHYMFNSLLTTVALATNLTLVNIVLSVVVTFMPLLIAVFFWIRAIIKKGFLTDLRGITNYHIDQIIHTTKEYIDHARDTFQGTYHSALSKKVVVSVCFLAGVAFVLWLFVKTQVAIQTTHPTITRVKAQALAEKALAEAGVSPSGYSSVVTYSTEIPPDMELEYLLKYGNVKNIKALYSHQIPTALWNVWFYKPLQEDEYEVSLSPDGKLYAVDYTLAETAEGDRLSKEAALQIAIRYLKAEQYEDMDQYKLIESDSEEMPNRKDYTFIFEKKDGHIKDAAIRIAIDIVGNKPSGFTKYIKIPEEWERAFEKLTTFDFISNLILSIPLMALFIYGIVLFFRFVKRGSIHFKQAFLITSPLIAFIFLLNINAVPLFFSNYVTSIPVASYSIESLAMVVLEAVGAVLVGSGLMGMLFALWRKHFGEIIPEGASKRFSLFRDALFIGYTFPVIIAGYIGLMNLIDLHFTISVLSLFPESPAGLDEFSPAISVFTTLPMVWFFGILIAIGLLLLKNLFKSAQKVIGILVIFLLAFSLKEIISSSDTWKVMLQSALNIISLALAIFACLRIIKNNLLAYVMIIYTGVLFNGALLLWTTNTVVFRLNGWFLFVLGIMPLFVYLIISSKITGSKKERHT